MRIWQFWWRTLVYYPPFFVELLMTALAFLFLVLWGFSTKNCWPYLVLSSSYAMGSAMSMWVRETITPSPQPRMTYLISVLLLFYGLYCFTELTPYVKSPIDSH